MDGWVGGYFDEYMYIWVGGWILDEYMYTWVGGWIPMSTRMDEPGSLPPERLWTASFSLGFTVLFRRQNWRGTSESRATYKFNFLKGQDLRAL